MRQRHTFNLEKRERVKEIGRLLIGLMDELGLQAKSGGGFMSRTRPIDFGAYLFVSGEAELGRYEYELKEGAYNCFLDLAGMPEKTYQTTMNIIKQKIPEIQK